MKYNFKNDIYLLSEMIVDLEGNDLIKEVDLSELNSENIFKIGDEYYLKGGEYKVSEISKYGRIIYLVNFGSDKYCLELDYLDEE